MKVLFLDIDGVLNNNKLLDKHGPDYIDPKKVEILKSIIFITKTKIVLSSSWRLYEYSKKIAKRALSEYELNFIGCTKNIPKSPRCEEIKDYVDSNKIKEFAILDDDPEAGIGLENNFFQTDPRIGLSHKIAEKIINHFER